MSFSFSFSGDDIEDQDDGVQQVEVPKETGSAAPIAAPSSAQLRQANSAFPVEGKPQLQPTRQNMDLMLSLLPSKVAYDLLSVTLGDGRIISLPRRELWDVRVQLMAEDDGSGSTTEGLGNHDVKTGVYEGGFKSWESSVDLVKVLASLDYGRRSDRTQPLHVIEVRRNRNAIRLKSDPFTISNESNLRANATSTDVAGLWNCVALARPIPASHVRKEICCRARGSSSSPSGPAHDGGRLQPISPAACHST